jgi:uncharacterized protein
MTVEGKVSSGARSGDMQTIRPQQRIELIDALRGYALMGLFLIHMVEYFELYWANPIPSAVNSTLFFLFGGKAYAMFGLLFGVSFYILMEGQARRGVDFRARFVWRLMVLLTIGYLHSLVYGGDILTILAITGLVLVPLYRWGNAILLFVAAFFVLQGPMLLLQAVGFRWDPGVHGTLMDAYAHGSFWDVLRVNAWEGQLGKWGFMTNSGRLWNIVGLSVLGFVLGRVAYFVELERYRSAHRRTFIVLLALAILLLAFKADLSALFGGEVAGRVFDSYTQISLMLLTVMGLVLLYRSDSVARVLRLLAPCGRMTLSIYVFQSLLLVPFFYGFGAGAHVWLGQTLSAGLGAALWCIQVWLAHLWFRNHHYGPLEWVWRSATLMRTDIPFRKLSGAQATLSARTMRPPNA